MLKNIIKTTNGDASSPFESTATIICVALFNSSPTDLKDFSVKGSVSTIVMFSNLFEKPRETLEERGFS